MAEREWTPDQKNAIEARGGTLLVSAAAGSGKTAVLVERVVQRLLDPAAAEVDVDAGLAARHGQQFAQGLGQVLGIFPGHVVFVGAKGNTQA